MSAFELKRIIARYLRYDLQCPILALEAASSLATSYNDGGSADLIAVDKKRHIIEVEVKVSLSDMRADRRKNKHEYYRKCCNLPYKNQQLRFGQIVKVEPKTYPTHLFYFAVPLELVNKAKILCDKVYPYAGILTNNRHYYGGVTVERQAKMLNPERASLLQMTKLAKGQSATIVRLLEQLSEFVANGEG